MISILMFLLCQFKRTVTQLQKPVSTAPNDSLCHKFHFLCVLTPDISLCRLTSGSAITISIFFSASTANSANRLFMTNSPGFSSGSMVMLDMAAMLCFSHERGVTEEGARRLLTLLLTGAEAVERKGWEII